MLISVGIKYYVDLTNNGNKKKNKKKIPILVLKSGSSCKCISDRSMDDLQLYGFFNSISVIILSG